MAKDTSAAPAAPDPKKDTAIAKTAAPKYPIISTAADEYPLIANGKEAIEMFRENLAGQAIDPFSLTIIKVPSGGATMWQVPTYSGMEVQKYIQGIVIQIAQRRAYWKSPNPSGQPPDCASQNLEIGVGDNGTGQGSHECANCPMAQFGTSMKPDGSKGLGQACKQNKLLFMLTPGNPMPVILKISPASLKPVLRFQTQMPVRFSGAVVKFGLAGTKNREGTPYAEVVPEFVGALPPEQAAYVQQFARLMAGELEKAADVAAATSDESGE